MSMHIYSMGQNVKYFCVFTLRKEKILNMTNMCLLRFMFLCTDPFLAAAEDQEGLYAVFLQIRIPLTSKTWFHLIVSVEVLQGGLGDVDPPTRR